MYYTKKEKERFEQVFDLHEIPQQNRHDLMREVKNIYIDQITDLDRHIIKLERKLKSYKARNKHLRRIKARLNMIYRKTKEDKFTQLPLTKIV